MHFGSVQCGAGIDNLYIKKLRFGSCNKIRIRVRVCIKKLVKNRGTDIHNSYLALLVVNLIHHPTFLPLFFMFVTDFAPSLP